MSSSPTSRQRQLVLCLFALAGFASSANIRLYDSLLPQIAKDFSASPGEVAGLSAAYALSYGLFQVVLGPVGDKIGKYRLVQILCLASFVTTLAGALAGSLGQLMMARFLGGAAGAAIVPLCVTWVGETVPEDRRQQALAMVMSVMFAGITAGQLIGGLGGQMGSWRLAPVLIAACFLLAGIAIAVSRRSAGPEPRNATLSPKILRGLLAGMWRGRFARLVLLAVGIEGLGFCASAFLGLLMALRFGTDPAVIGLILALYAIGGAFNPVLMRLVFNRVGQAGYFTLVSLMSGVSLLVMAGSVWFWIVPEAAFVGGLGSAGMHSALQAQGTQLLPGARSTGFAFFAMTFFLAQSLGTAVYGVMADRAGIGLPFVIGGLVMIGLGLWFPRRLRRVQGAG